MKHLVFFVLGLLLLTLIDQVVATRLIFFFSYLTIIVVNRDKNIFTLAVTILAFKIVEVVSHEIFGGFTGVTTSAFAANNIIFGTHLFYDFLLLLVIAFRAPIWRQLLTNHQEIHLLKTDMHLFMVYLLFIVADSLALGENLLRHMEYFGASLETAKHFRQWSFVWHNYEFIKRTLLCLEFLVLWSMVVPLPIFKKQLNKP